MKKTLSALAVFGMVLGMSGMAEAATTATQNVTASATIIPSCQFGTAATLPFGNVGINDLIDGKTETTAASVKIICTNTGVAAKLYGGTSRVMTNATNNLNYQVYTDAGHSTPLGTDATAGAAVTASGIEQEIPLYGKILANQPTVAANLPYTQNLALTVEF